MIKKIMNNEFVVALILSIFTYCMFVFQTNIQFYEPLSWLLFIIIFILYKKYLIFDKNKNVSLLFISLLFSLSTVLGKILYLNYMNAENALFYQLFKFENIVSIIGLFTLIYTVLKTLFYNCDKLKIFDKTSKLSNKKCFLVSFIVIMIFWIPYFLALFPGELSGDSISEVQVIVDNFSVLSNHHPLIHIIAIAIPYKIGYFIFKSSNMAIACASFGQMIIMASIFSYFITFLNSRKVKKVVLFIVLLFYSIVPMHAFYSVTIWKDVIFSGLVLLLTIKLYQLYEIKERLKLKNLIGFIIISLLTLFFRNNAIYMYFILIIITLMVFKSKIKYFIYSFIIIIFSYYMVMYPLFNMLNVKRSSSSEYIAIPLQQIGRIVYKDGELSKKEQKQISKLIDINILKNVYNPYSVDSIKFNSNYNASEFDSNKGEFFKLWLNLIKKHPYISVESYAISTLGYWYPGIDNWVICNGIEKNNFNITREPKGIKMFNNLIDKMDSKDIPILGLFWSTSVGFYLILVSLCYIITKSEKEKILFYVPVLGIWLTMMVAAPTFAEFRYIYPLYTCLPFLMILPFFLKPYKKAKTKK